MSQHVLTTYTSFQCSPTCFYKFYLLCPQAFGHACMEGIGRIHWGYTEYKSFLLSRVEDENKDCGVEVTVKTDFKGMKKTQAHSLVVSER